MKLRSALTILTIINTQIPEIQGSLRKNKIGKINSQKKDLRMLTSGMNTLLQAKTFLILLSTGRVYNILNKHSK